MHRKTSLFSTNWFWISNYPIRVGTWKSHISYVSVWKSCCKKRTPDSPLPNVKCNIRFKFLERDPESLVFCWGTIRWSRCCCNFFSPNMTSDCTSRVVPATQDNFKSICRPTTVICKNYLGLSSIFHWTVLELSNLESIRNISSFLIPSNAKVPNSSDQGLMFLIFLYFIFSVWFLIVSIKRILLWNKNQTELVLLTYWWF